MWVITLSHVTIDDCNTQKENCTASSSSQSSQPANPTAELLMKNNIKQKKLIIHDPAIIFNGFS